MYIYIEREGEIGSEREDFLMRDRTDRQTQTHIHPLALVLSLPPSLSSLPFPPLSPSVSLSSLSLPLSSLFLPLSSLSLPTLPNFPSFTRLGANSFMGLRFKV